MFFTYVRSKKKAMLTILRNLKFENWVTIRS